MIRSWKVWLIVLSIALVFSARADIQVGADRASLYLPWLKDQRVGVVVNSTSMTKDGHLVDFLLAQKVNVTAVFAPEHGFRIDQGAGAKVSDKIDEKTGLPIVSLYGKTKKPTPDMLSNIDVLVFDIQDVGVRFYTYISTMHYVMEAAAELDKTVIVLDRPNPNGAYVDGPILEPNFSSFVGMHPIPVLHGLTVAELALMIKGEHWITQANALDLRVVPIARYTRDMPYSLPIPPSPNLPTDQAIALYPSLCFFEATAVSIGRGTTMPFEVFGHDHVPLGDFVFTPVSMPGKSLRPKLQNQRVLGRNLSNETSRGLSLTWLIDARNTFAANQQILFTRPDFMDLLAGTDKLRKAIQSGVDEQTIRASWQQGLSHYRKRRLPYLLYPDVSK